MTIIFDRTHYKLLQDGSAYSFADSDFIHRRIEKDTMDRLLDIKRDFNKILILGARISPEFISFLKAQKKAQHISVTSISQKQLSALKTALKSQRNAEGENCCEVEYAEADEEVLPFKTPQFDLVLSAGHLHHVNDIPGALIQARRALKPDGLFMGAMAGGQTLHQLRHCLMEAESELYGGASPRVSPFADIQDVAGLMQRAGFALPVVDHDIIKVDYRRLDSLFRDLKNMGERLCLAQRNRAYRNAAYFERVRLAYEQNFVRDNGLYPVDFEIVSMHGWSPHDSQQKPSRRGSAQISLTDVL